MAADASLYPPAPDGVPGDLAKPGLRYRLQACRVLVALVLFLLFYGVLLVVAVGLMWWAVAPWSQTAAPEGWRAGVFLGVVRASVFLLAAMFFAFLVKGCFRRTGQDLSQWVRVTEREQPDLFAFIRSLCRELGCAAPSRVFLNHEANAAVVYPTSIVNLVVPPRKDLLIGLGLLNELSVVEFKALLAHELGHFSQRVLRLDAYVSVAYQVFANMVEGRDGWDRWVFRATGQPWISAFAVPLFAFAELARTLLKAAFRPLRGARLSLRRQTEFNADLVAVGAAGSDALVHLLLKGDFAHACLMHADQELAFAADHGFLSRDVFYHQQCSATRLRTAAGDPNLGRPPEPPGDGAARPSVFKPEATSTPAMWSEHPPPFDREQNARRRYFPSPPCGQPAWKLFRNQDVLREEVSRAFYAARDATVEGPLTAPEPVQAFIDAEHASLRFDPRYRGVYDGRFLELRDFPLLVAEARVQPLPDGETVAHSGARLYSDELALWVEGHQRRRNELNALEDLCASASGPTDFDYQGRRYPAAEAEDTREKARADMEEDLRYLAAFDRSAFLLHYQACRQVGRESELLSLYDFYLRVQELVGWMWGERRRMESVLGVLRSGTLTWERVSALRETLTQVQDTLQFIFARAFELRLPPLEHLPPSGTLASLLPALPALNDVIAADSISEVDVPGILAFHQEIILVADRLEWVRTKSLVGILAFQHDAMAAPPSSSPNEQKKSMPSCGC